MSGQLCEQPRLIVGAWASASHGRWCGIVDGVRAADTSPAQPSPAQPSPAQPSPAPDTGTGQEVGWGWAVIRDAGEMYLGKWCLC